MSSAGEIDRFHEDGFPGLLSPPPSRDTTRGVEAEGAARGELEADDSTRVGGRTTRGKRAADDRTTQQEGGAHDVVGGGGDDGNCGGDSGGGGWSSEVGGAPTSMPGTAALATAPASGGG